MTCISVQFKLPIPSFLAPVNVSLSITLPPPGFLPAGEVPCCHFTIPSYTPTLPIPPIPGLAAIAKSLDKLRAAALLTYTPNIKCPV